MCVEHILSFLDDSEDDQVDELIRHFVQLLHVDHRLSFGQVIHQKVIENLWRVGKKSAKSK